MNKGNTESHAETRSSRRESNPPTSALSAAPREKKIRLGDLVSQRQRRHRSFSGRGLNREGPAYGRGCVLAQSGAECENGVRK